MRYLLLCLLLLGGCAGHAVSDAGAGRHSVTATSTHGVLAAREQALKQANKYCGRNGLRAVVESYEDKTLDAIAAAVVGGVALTGGRGSVIGVLLGCLLLVSLPPACEYLHLPTTWQRTLVGVVMVIAVTLDALWRRRQA